MFTTPNFRNYGAFVRHCLEVGEVTASRVGPMNGGDVGRTKELRSATFELTPGDSVWRPGYSPRLAWLEALHLLSGTFDPAHFEAVSPKAAGMFTPEMAYGPRVQPQMVRVCRELEENPHSRRAIVFVSDNDSWPPPCTNSIQWLVRDNRIETFVSMRSWDLVLGLPYDVFMFGALALAVSGALGLPVGPLRVQAASAHVYEKHWGTDPSMLENVPGSFEVASRNWSRLGDRDGIPRYWRSVKNLAERALVGVPWADEATRVVGPGLITVRRP
jgi:hypothetical protein